jgi:translation initiation factor 4E
LIRPNDLSNANDYHFFRAGIKPMWEDAANKRGGKFSVRLRKGFASLYWESLLFAVIGEQFGVGSELCGIGVSLRYNEDILSVWNATADDHLAKKQIYSVLCTIMPLVAAATSAAIDYKAHDAALQSAAQRRRQQRALQKKGVTPGATATTQAGGAAAASQGRGAGGSGPAAVDASVVAEVLEGALEDDGGDDGNEGGDLGDEEGSFDD